MVSARFWALGSLILTGCALGTPGCSSDSGASHTPANQSTASASRTASGSSTASGSTASGSTASGSSAAATSSVTSTGAASTRQDGTLQHPFLIPGDPLLPDYRDSRDTRTAPSDVFDTYPGYPQIDESGPEFVYRLRCHRRTVVRARIGPEPSGTDVDLHLLSSVNPTVLVTRGHRELRAVLEPGDYYLVLDTFVSGGVAKLGRYDLVVELEDWHAGTLADPILPGEHPVDPIQLPLVYTDARDTKQAVSDAFDSYAGHRGIDESGPEFVYRFVLAEPARLAATIGFKEPAGTDVDLHLMSGASSSVLVARGNTSIYAVLQPGTYHLILDTYVAGGVEKRGPYQLRLSIRPRDPAPSTRFNDYVLAAVDALYAKHRLQGYGASVLTHDIPYGSQGTIPATGGTRTMCVAAVMEVILTAMTIWSEDRRDPSVFSFLPLKSWKTLHSNHIKAHLWVNHRLNSSGTADALRNFGMGERVPFEKLKPGAFINLNRTTRTGHAVVFLAFIDALGREYATWNSHVIGFKYFSAQGGSAVGAGGLDFRYAVFNRHGSPAMPYKRDLRVIYSTNQRYLNTGEMWSPPQWRTP